MGDKPSKGFKSDGHRLGGAGQDDSSPTKQAPPPKKSVFKKKKAPPRAPIDPAERAKQAEERRRAAEQRSNAFDNKLKSQRAKKVGSPLSLSLSRTHNPRALRDLRKCRWGVGTMLLVRSCGYKDQRWQRRRPYLWWKVPLAPVPTNLRVPAAAPCLPWLACNQRAPLQAPSSSSQYSRKYAPAGLVPQMFLARVKPFSFVSCHLTQPPPTPTPTSPLVLRPPHSLRSPPLTRVARLISRARVAPTGAKAGGRAGPRRGGARPAPP
jgi:hypothetical protein